MFAQLNIPLYFSGFLSKANMKKLEKWLTKPTVQRVVYLLLLFLCLYILSSNGMLQRGASLNLAWASSVVVPAGLILALGAQLIWNRKWLWMVLCALMIGFTLWLATLSLNQIITVAGTPARTVVWGIGIIGFSVVLILVLAFLNWMLLHMKPKK